MNWSLNPSFAEVESTFFFRFPPLFYLSNSKKKEGKDRLVTNIWFYFESSSPLSMSITRMKKKEMSTHLGINDWFLSINLLKIRTIEYLVPVPRKDMFLDLALKILLLFFVFHIGIHYIMLRDIYVVKDHLYLCAESLIQIEMCNNSVDKIFFSFFFLKQKAGSLSAWEFPRKIFEKYSFIIILCYMIWDQKKEKARSIFHINGGNKIRDVENKTGIFYNDTVDELKGM